MDDRLGSRGVVGILVRAGLAGLVVLVLQIRTERSLLAHGGQFVPPPPTPDSSTPLDTPRETTPTFVDPGVGGPIVTPGGGSLRPGAVGHRPGAVTPSWETSWNLWWRIAGERLVPAHRLARLAGAVATPGGAVPGAAASAGAWVAERDRLVRERVVPLLLHLLDPASKAPPDVVASAAIALGKVAYEPEQAEPLLAWLGDEKAPDLAREGAALGLGLLRRTDPKRQLPAGLLDPVRARLLQEFDRIVDGKHVQVPARARMIAILSMGLLGDQPFHTDPQSVSGRLMTSLLWQRFTVLPHKTVDAPIALVTAIGLEPPEGVPDGLRNDLLHLALGRKVRNRRYGAYVGAHALTAYVRLSGAEGRSAALRILGDARAEAGPRLAAVLAISEATRDMSAEERRVAARVLLDAAGRDEELLTAGLLDITLGRLVAADLADASDALLADGKVGALLFDHLEAEPWYLQGFSAIAVGIAAGAATGDGEARVALRTRARDRLRALLGDKTREASPRAAAALALGLARATDARDGLLAILRGSGDAGIRGAAALALAWLGPGDPASVAALLAVVLDPNAPPEVREKAARALSALDATAATEKLVALLEKGGHAWQLAAVTTALGRLGDLAAVEPLARIAASDAYPELVRAMAVVGLGILGDPEERPSLERLLRALPYPMRTDALEELITIL